MRARATSPFRGAKRNEGGGAWSAAECAGDARRGGYPSITYHPNTLTNAQKRKKRSPSFFAEIRVETLIAEFQSSRNDRLCRICNTRCTTSSKLCALPTRDPVTSSRSVTSASNHAPCLTMEDLMSFTAKSLADCHNLLSPSIDLDLPLRSRLAISSQSPHSRGT